MSDVLIRSMEMPSIDLEWRIIRGQDGKWYAIDVNAETSDGEWHEIVPVPEHGRLIDADAVERNLLKMQQAQTGPCSHGVRKSRAVLRDAPTIIPADKEGEG